MTERKPFAITVQDLVARGRNDIPAELITSTHLIYNSPAALAFNSPRCPRLRCKTGGTFHSRLGHDSHRPRLLRTQYDDPQ